MMNFATTNDAPMEITAAKSPSHGLSILKIEPSIAQTPAAMALSNTRKPTKASPVRMDLMTSSIHGRDRP